MSDPLDLQPVRNAVDNPILNSPFEEPRRHYDFSGPVPRIVEGRRPAGYHGLPRTEQAHGAVAAHEFFPLPLVNDVRERAWRAAGYPNVTRTTRDLLDHWNRPERRPLFFCQREAVETINLVGRGHGRRQTGHRHPAGRAQRPRERTEVLRPAASVLREDGDGVGQDDCHGDAVRLVNSEQGCQPQGRALLRRGTGRGPNLTVKERLQVLDPGVPTTTTTPLSCSQPASATSSPRAASS